jgi:cytochrome c oxidase subunit 2
MLALTGCSSVDFGNGFEPSSAVGVTNHTNGIINFWTTSWVVLFGVGFISWGLMAWAIVVYRRRKGDTSTPPQLRYNNPIEALFTIVPLILVIGFFAKTATTMGDIEKPYANPDVKIQVIGKQWSWDFNYLESPSTPQAVYTSGVQVKTGDVTKKTADMPVLYLPLGKTVELDLQSRDVIHSFWVVQFLYKKDVFPGRWNHEYFTPTKVGTYTGKCAELCGEYHSMMLFQVKVVTPEEYTAYINGLAAKGQTGELSINDSREQNLPGNGSTTGNEG